MGLEPSFFVTTARMKVISSERDLVTSEEEDAASAVRGRTLYLSLPFCRIMTDCELRAVLAHELGHFRGRDSRYSQAFNPLWRGAVRQLVRMKEDIEEGLWRGLPLRPAFYVLRFYLECFKEAEARVNRTRELAADQVSVRVTDHQTVATALVKIHGFGRYWKRALALLRERIGLFNAGSSRSGNWSPSRWRALSVRAMALLCSETALNSSSPKASG